MILWKGKESRETSPALPSVGIRAWRWVFEITRSRKMLSVGFKEQVKFQDAEWHDANSYYMAWLTERWHLGREHMYYDGPHDSFSIGFLHIGWSADWCEECAGEG